jgi:uncharacterized membrane protein
MLEILFVIAGVLTGAVVEGDDGLLFGALIGFLCGHLLSTRNLVRKLTRQIQSLEQRVDLVASELAPVELDIDLPVATVTTPLVAPDLGANRDLSQPLTRDPDSAAAPAAQQGFRPGWVTPPSADAAAARDGADGDAPLPGAGPQPAPQISADYPITRAFRAALGFLRGGNPMVRIGIVVLFFGMSFLAKLAIDANLISPEMRLVGIAIGGFALSILGWRFRISRPAFALPLQGGGIGVLFLCVFAGYRLYGLIPPGLCFAVLLGLVVACSLLAVVQNSLALAALGVSGGFLAPILASSGTGDHVALFSYFLILNLGIVVIAWFKSWRVLNWLGFMFTFVIGALWGAKAYRPEDFDTTEPFLIAHFVLYVAISVLFASRQEPKLRGLVDSTLVFGTPLVVFALQSQLVEGIDQGMAWSAVAGATFYLALATFLVRKAHMRLLFEAFVATGVVLATIAIPLALDARWTALTWSLEGAGMLWLGVRQGRMLPRIAGIGLQFFAGLAWFIHVDNGFADALFLLGAEFLGAILLAVSGLFTGLYLFRSHARVHTNEFVAAWVLGAWGLAWWYGAGLMEIGWNAPVEAKWGILLIFLAASALIAAFAERRYEWLLLRAPGVSLVFLLAAAALGMTELEHPLQDFGWLGWPAAFATQLIVLRLFDDWHNPVRGVLHAATLWLFVALVTWCGAFALTQLFTGVHFWEPVSWGMVPALLVLLATYAAAGTRWPLATMRNTYLSLGLIPIVIYLGVWLVVANALPPSTHWPIAYAPIFNPLDVSNAVVLMAVLTWYRACRRHDADWALFTQTGIGVGILGAALFYWANTVLFRSIHFWAEVPYDLHSLWRSDLTQTSLALFWSIAGVLGMITGARLARRTLWFAAATLMACVVGKLFFVDLANTDTLERVISFLGVGLLMVLVGYFAPVPPRQHHASDELSAPPAGAETSPEQAP